MKKMMKMLLFVGVLLVGNVTVALQPCEEGTLYVSKNECQCGKNPRDNQLRKWEVAPSPQRCSCTVQGTSIVSFAGSVESYEDKNLQKPTKLYQCVIAPEIKTVAPKASTSVKK